MKDKIKIKDVIWFIIVMTMVLALLSKEVKAYNNSYPYLLGFIKFFLLATMGELLATRLSTGKYIFKKYFILRAIIWGIVGLLVTYIFGVYYEGVKTVFKNKYLHAFMTSVTMNFTFGVVLMATHKVTDTILDHNMDIKAVNNIDWNSWINFIVVKTVPYFWIPAHTITFLLPSEYRVLVAALLSIALGFLLAIVSLKGRKNEKSS